MLAWIVRYWFASFLAVAALFLCFWETAQWSFRRRLMIAWTRLVCFLLVLVPVLVLVSPLLASLRSSSPALLNVQVVFVAPALGKQPVVSRPVVPMSSQRGTSVLGRPSLSPTFIDEVLQRYHSPAAGTGWALYSLSQRYGIDDSFALGFFWHESHFGLDGEAAGTRSIGNLRCIASAACVDEDRGGYAAFPDWPTGYAAWFALLDGPLYVGAGLTTVETIIPRYAPTADHNDEQSYIANVLAVVQQLRAGQEHLG